MLVFSEIVKIASIKTIPPEIVKEGIKRWILIVGGKMMLTVNELDEGVAFPRHSHPHEEVKYIISGRIELRTPAGSKILEAGMGCVLSPNEPHEAYVPGPGSVVYINAFSPPREDYLKGRRGSLT